MADPRDMNLRPELDKAMGRTANPATKEPSSNPAAFTPRAAAPDRAEATGDKTTTPEHGFGSQMAAAIGKYFGIGQATDRKVNVDPSKPFNEQPGLMEAVDNAVSGAKGANPDY